METKRQKEGKIIAVLKKIFMAVVIVIFAYFIWGQLFLAHEQEIGEGEYRTFFEGWVWLKEDGNREILTIPGKSGANRNELVVVENTIPEDVQDNMFLCIRSAKQETKIYIETNEDENTATPNLMGLSKSSAKGKVHSNMSLPHETREKSNK